MSSKLNQMSAVQVAPSGERSQGRGRYGVVCRGNPVWSIPERLELKFHDRRYTSMLYLYLFYLNAAARTVTRTWNYHCGSCKTNFTGSACRIESSSSSEPWCSVTFITQLCSTCPTSARRSPTPPLVVNYVPLDFIWSLFHATTGPRMAVPSL